MKYLPVLGICGFSGAGKTTLVEQLIRSLIESGLRVAVVKHGAHNVTVDCPGKDSDRFFLAGADVCLFGEEQFYRQHEEKSLDTVLCSLCSDHDLVLVEGHASTQVQKVWLLGKGHHRPPADAADILLQLSRQEATPERVLRFINTWLKEKWMQTPVFACVLIGGKSSRMGRPKHLLNYNGCSWLEHTVEKLRQVTMDVIVSGRGDLPDSMANLTRVPDIHEMGGPLSGILSAMRWNPFVSWLVVACDMPDLDPKALSWLLKTRNPGIWATLPDLHGDGRVEPLLAHYDFRCKSILEKIGQKGKCKVSRIVGLSGIFTPQPPKGIWNSWNNVNTPLQLVESRGE